MDTILQILGECAIRATVVMVTVILILRALRVRSPRVLHRTWTGVLLAMLLLPAIKIWSPGIPLRVLPPPPQAVPRQSSEAAPARWEARPIGLTAASDAPSLPVPVQSSPAPPVGGDAFGVPETLFLIYLAGLSLLLIRLLLGMVLALRLFRGAASDGACFYSERCSAPVSLGWFRPRVLLPAHAMHWGKEKLDAVMAHEQAHARRRDPLIEWFAMLNRCVYWFHPLAWWLRRRLAVLAEQACDEAVLAKGHEPAHYAGLLLELARSVTRRGRLVSVWGSTFNGSTLAVRIRSILTAGDYPAPSATKIVVLVFLSAGAIFVPALVTPVRSQATIQTSSHEAAPGSSAINDAGMVATSRISQAATPGTEMPQSAGNPQKTLEKAEPPSDQKLFQTGMDLLAQGRYEEARSAFQRLIRNYPGSAFEPDALLKSADAYASQGGAKGRQLAEDQYRNFIIFFPTHPKAAEAQMKIAAARMKLMNSPDRNTSNAVAAEAELKKFLQLYPNVDYAHVVRQYLAEVQKNLAAGDSSPGRTVQEQAPVPAQAVPLSESHRKWLEEEVVYIITTEERNVFLALRTDEEREHFIRQFWARRNTDRQAADNPAKQEHYRRLAYANARFACAIPGWKTDRGRIYILYGEPDGKESHPTGGTYSREFWEGGGQTRVDPFEIWRYASLPGRDKLEFVFVDKNRDGTYLLLPAGKLENRPLLAGPLMLTANAGPRIITISSGPTLTGTYPLTQRRGADDVGSKLEGGDKSE
jgi:GWxTD domain-containing protein